MGMLNIAKDAGRDFRVGAFFVAENAETAEMKEIV